MQKTFGIHHLSAMIDNVQNNIDFYENILGLRLVKKTVNFDDPSTYHLYFGNYAGNPGTLLTFFPNENYNKGIIGDGQVGVIHLIIPIGSMAYWNKRLNDYNIETKFNYRFNEKYLSFKDVHGLNIEFVEREVEDRTINSFRRDFDYGIVAIGGVTLFSYNPEKTVSLLTMGFGLNLISTQDDVFRLKSIGDFGNIIDVTKADIKGHGGKGTFHHLAFRANDDYDHQFWKELITRLGYKTTDILDRKYFKSFYFREHGHILFEIATDNPGFIVDENLVSLGEGFMLPNMHEHYRIFLENKLVKLKLNRGKRRNK